MDLPQNQFNAVMDRLDSTGDVLLGSTQHLYSRLKEAHPMPFLLDPGFKAIMDLYEEELSDETEPQRLKYIRRLVVELHKHFDRLGQTHGKRAH